MKTVKQEKDILNIILDHGSSGNWTENFPQFPNMWKLTTLQSEIEGGW